MVNLSTLIVLILVLFAFGCSSSLSESDAKELALQEVSNYFDSQLTELSESELEKAKNNLSVTHMENINGTWDVVVFSSKLNVELRVVVTSRENVKIPGLTVRAAEDCIFPTLIVCVDHVVSEDSITLNFKNNAGRAMVISGVDFYGPFVIEGCRAEVNKEVDDGEIVEAKATACNINSGNKDLIRIDAEIDYSYVDSPKIEHKMPGELRTRVR